MDHTSNAVSRRKAGGSTAPPGPYVPSDGSRHESRLGMFLGGAVLCSLVLMLYLKTLAPGVLYYQRPVLMDAAMLEVHAYTLGVTHPTGYPTYLLLTHLFTYLPFGDVAYRVNLASAVYAAVAVLLVYVVGLLLTGRVVAAGTGALAFGVGAIFWSVAIIAEVYTLNVLFVGLVIATLLLWRKRRQDRYLLLAAFLMGLSLTNHLTSGLLVPAGALFVALVDRHKLADLRLVLKGAVLFVVGLAPYIYLPVRAAADPALKEADPTSLGRFLGFVSGSELQGGYLSLHPADFAGGLIVFGAYLAREFYWVLLLVGALGLWAMVRRDRPAAAMTVALCVGWVLHASAYNIHDFFLYFIPAYMIVGLWISVGVGFLLEVVEHRIVEPPRLRKAALLLLSAGFVLLPLAGAKQIYAWVDRSHDDKGRRIIEAVARNTEPGATVLHNRSSLWYMVLVEKRRTDLTLLDPFRPETITTHDLVWPDDVSPEKSYDRYGTYDNTGVEAARVAVKEAPVYLLDQESANPADFKDAGFKMVEVEEGILYRLVPAEQQNRAAEPDSVTSRDAARASR
jgi:hypothetical protein